MAADVFPITLYTNADYTLSGTWKNKSNNTPINISGYSAKFQIRENADDDTALVSLTQSSGITLGGSAGTFVVTIPKATIAGLTIERGVYDLVLTSGAGVSTVLVRGEVAVVKGVSR